MNFLIGAFGDMAGMLSGGGGGERRTFWVLGSSLSGGLKVFRRNLTHLLALALTLVLSFCLVAFSFPPSPL